MRILFITMLCVLLVGCANKSRQQTAEGEKKEEKRGGMRQQIQTTDSGECSDFRKGFYLPPTRPVSRVSWRHREFNEADRKQHSISGRSTKERD